MTTKEQHSSAACQDQTLQIYCDEPYVGQCLTIGVVPLTLIGGFINAMNEDKGHFSIPWPIFWDGMAGLFIVGIGMIFWKYNLARSYDPNDQDVEARKCYGQSRAILVQSEQGATVESWITRFRRFPE
jgi:hypothetical protein